MKITSTVNLYIRRSFILWKKGIAASKGYAIGKVFLQENNDIIISDSKVVNVNEEKEKMQKALKESKAQLEAIKV